MVPASLDPKLMRSTISQLIHRAHLGLTIDVRAGSFGVSRAEKITKCEMADAANQALAQVCVVRSPHAPPRINTRASHPRNLRMFIN